MEKRTLDEALYVMGNAPKDGEKVIYIHQSHVARPEILPDLFQFALEAYASGYTLMTTIFKPTMETVLEAAFLLDKPFYVMLNRSLRGWRLNDSGHKVMLTRGGFLTPAGLDPEDRIGYMVKSRIQAVEMSHATLLLDNDYQDMAKETLDRGHDLAVLRSTMDDKEILSIVKEGAPVIDTFSNWMEFPKAISFEMENGPFKEPNTGKRYSVIIL